jgi:hypothetical protein
MAGIDDKDAIMFVWYKFIRRGHKGYWCTQFVSNYPMFRVKYNDDWPTAAFGQQPHSTIKGPGGSITEWVR